MVHFIKTRGNVVIKQQKPQLATYCLLTLCNKTLCSHYTYSNMTNSYYRHFRNLHPIPTDLLLKVRDIYNQMCHENLKMLLLVGNNVDIICICFRYWTAELQGLRVKSILKAHEHCCSHPSSVHTKLVWHISLHT